MTDAQKAKEFLATEEHMVLAVTCEDGTPWAVPVKIQLQWGVAFEWSSSRDSRHSKAIERNPRVAITLFRAEASSQVGIYATGKGELLESEAKGPGRYRFIAKQMWINDESFVKREVSLDELINQTEE